MAQLRLQEGRSLHNLAIAARRAGQELIRSWSALLSGIAFLQSRLAQNTLLLGTVRKDETDYYAYQLAATSAAQDEPVPPPMALNAMASNIGYTLVLHALHRGLDCLQTMLQPLWPVAQRMMVESFVCALLCSPLAIDACPVHVQVFQALDVIPRTAGLLGHTFPGENAICALIQQILYPQNYDPAFCAAVLRKWRSDGVSSVLQARGMLQTDVADAQKTSAAFHARERADIANHGLRDCALPSCAKTEKTVKEFAGCSGCRSVVYCCAEHQGLDWPKHKKACHKKQAARLAADETEKEVGAAAAT